MASTTSSLSLSSLKPALPVFTGLLGVLGLGGGIYNFANPVEGARAFGLVAPSGVSSQAAAFQTAYIRIHGIRNIGMGLVNLSLVLFWQFSDLCRTSPIAAEALKRILAINFLLGPIVGLGDAWILKQFADSPGVEPEAANLGREKSQGHAVTAVLIASLGLGWLYA